jgi:hypothetical protein
LAPQIAYGRPVPYVDTLPLFVAISIYVFFWPGRIIGDGVTATPGIKEHSSIDSTSVPAEQKD